MSPIPPTTPAGSRLPPGLPYDWHFAHDFECPSCRYNLKMLREPRCPECGREFLWQQILHTRCPRCDQALDNCSEGQCPRCAIELNWSALIGAVDERAMSHFEYTSRPARAARRIVLTSLMPFRFWSQLPIEWTPVARRVRRFRLRAWLRGALGLAALSNYQFFAAGQFSVEYALICFSLAFVLPLVTIVGLPLFLPTLARFRVRSDQLLRVTGYLSSLVEWLGLVYLTTAAACAGVWVLARYGPTFRFPAISFLLAFDPVDAVGDLFAPLGFGTKMLWTRFDRPFSWTVLCATLWIGTITWLWSLYCALTVYLRIDRRNALALMASIAAIALLLGIMIAMVDYRAKVIFGRLLM